MYTFSSTILKNSKPVDSGFDLALAFAQANRKTLEEYIKTQTSAVHLIEAEIQRLKKKKEYFIGAGIAFFGILLMILGSLLLGIILMVGGSVWGYYSFDKQKEEISTKESLKKRLLSEPVPQSVTHLGKVHYVVNVVPFEDGRLLIDNSGTYPKEALTYPEIPQGIERLKSLSESLSQIPSELPIFLSSTAQTDLQDKPRLSGIEAEMEQVLNVSEKIFSDTADIRTELPVFHNTHNLVRSIQMLKEHIKKEDIPSLNLLQIDPAVDNAVKSLEQTSAEAAEVRKLGAENIETLMKDVVQRMDSYVMKTKKARDHSLHEVLSDGLDNLKHIYDYPLTRFYCPKCHQVEQYREISTPLPIDQVNQTTVESLSPFYRSQEMMHLRGLSDTIRRYLEQAQRTGEDLAAEHFSILREKLQSYEERIRELAVEIEGLDPKVELHKRNAILKYNSVKKLWICQLCGESFSDEQAHWARMLKVKDDLILPIWDNLWMEKHDERNRIIREKETELRSNKEKEASQIREEAKVFTEEYRAVRNHLEEAGSGYLVATQQLQMMLNFFSARGILSQDTIAAMSQYLNLGEGQSSTVGDIITTTDQLEFQLEQEPDGVFIRRGQLIDYADEVRNAEKYIAPILQEQNLLTE